MAHLKIYSDKVTSSVRTSRQFASRAASRNLQMLCQQKVSSCQQQGAVKNLHFFTKFQIEILFEHLNRFLFIYCQNKILISIFQIYFIIKTEAFRMIIQSNPALMDPPPMEFRLQQMQIHGPFNIVSFISFVSNNKSPSITEKNYWSPEVRQSGVQLYLSPSFLDSRQS